MRWIFPWWGLNENSIQIAGQIFSPSIYPANLWISLLAVLAKACSNNAAERYPLITAMISDLEAIQAASNQQQ